MASLSLRVIACIFLACLVSSPAASLSCLSVVGTVSPCFPYVKGTGTTPPPACCTGLKQLKAETITKADRVAACQCLKTATALMPGINYGRVNAAIKYCKVDFPTITPGIDCNRF